MKWQFMRTTQWKRHRNEWWSKYFCFQNDLFLESEDFFYSLPQLWLVFVITACWSNQAYTVNMRQKAMENTALDNTPSNIKHIMFNRIACDFIYWSRTLLLFTMQKHLTNEQYFQWFQFFTSAQQELTHFQASAFIHIFICNRQRRLCGFSVAFPSFVYHIENFSCYQLMFAFWTDWLNHHHQVTGFILGKKISTYWIIGDIIITYLVNTSFQNWINNFVFGVHFRPSLKLGV